MWFKVRRLVWIRIHAWGACGPGFKSQRPPPSYARKSTSTFSILASFFAQRMLYSASRRTSAVFYCMDCVFWCGRCTEPIMRGKRSVNRIALSEACDQFKGSSPKKPLLAPRILDSKKNLLLAVINRLAKHLTMTDASKMLTWQSSLKWLSLRQCYFKQRFTCFGMPKINSSSAGSILPLFLCSL